jgi:sugar-specific transcriptional regulator TrmB
LYKNISNKARFSLREIGLTDYETRTYLYLIQVGVTSASKISKNTEVPYSKIYQVLNSLEKKRWIESQSVRPRLYYPKSPSEALEATKLRMENKMKMLHKSVLDDLQPLYEKRDIREKPDVWILRGEFDAVAKLKDLIANTKNNLQVAVPTFAGTFLNSVIPFLRILPETGIDFLILISKEQIKLLKNLPKIGKIKERDRMFGGGIIADSREAILILGENGHPLIIWSDHMGLIKFAKDYFQYLWNTAKDL